MRAYAAGAAIAKEVPPSRGLLNGAFDLAVSGTMPIRRDSPDIDAPLGVALEIFAGCVAINAAGAAALMAPSLAPFCQFDYSACGDCADCKGMRNSAASPCARRAGQALRAESRPLQGAPLCHASLVFLNGC